ncbi:MAG: cytochrome c3 family protein [Acidobacteriota bacterium]
MSVFKYIKATLIGIWFISALGWITIGALSKASAINAASTIRAFVRVAATSTAKHKKIGKADCQACHAALIKHANVHPVAEGCDTCHEFKENQDTAEVKLIAEGNELCYTCHSEQKEALANKKIKHLAAETDCLSCHNPHASENPRLLNDKSPDLCFTCHADKQEDFSKKKFAHAPINDLGCQICHNPHAADFPTLLKTDKDALCVACHKANFKHKAQANGDLLIFADTTINPDYLSKAKKIMLNSEGKGHPYIGHPTMNVADPSQKDKKMSCTSCHNPHFGNHQQMFQQDLRGQQLCDKCHKER